MSMHTSAWTCMLVLMALWEVRTKVRGEDEQQAHRVESELPSAAIEAVQAELDAARGEIVASIRRIEG